MKISYKLASGGGYTVLFDEATGASVVSEFTPAFQATLQEENLYKSADRFRAGRGNIACSLPLEWVVTYDTRALAMASVRTIAGLLDTKLHLKVEQDSEVQYYPNTFITSYRPRPSGATMYHSIEFVSDNVTGIAP